METYLTLLYLTLEQEIAVKEFFAAKGWMYCKPDLNVMTERVGPFEIPTAQKVQTRNLMLNNDIGSSINYTKNAQAESSVSQAFKSDKTSKVSSTFVVKDIDDSEVKIEVSSEVDNFGVGDGYMEDNMDDGDNDDDFADSIDASVEDNATIHEYVTDEPVVGVDSNVGAHSKTDILSNSEGGSETCLVMTGKKNHTREDSTEAVSANFGDAKNKGVIDKKYIQSIVLKALKSSMSGKESTKDDFCTCSQCGKSVRNTGIRRHVLGHLNLPHKCGRCTIYFNSATELETHKERKHMGEYICNYCGVKYRHRNSLNEHIQKQHEGTAKVFECEICGVQMCRQRHLEDHMNTHKNVNPYSCSRCGKSYKNKCAYKRHSKTCGSNVKHACELCGQMYTTTLGLRDHIKRCHEGRYDFRCICGVDFKTRSARCRHRQYCDAYQSTKTSVGINLDKSNGVVESVLPGGSIAVSYSDNVEEDLANDMNIDDKGPEMIDIETNVGDNINSEHGYESQHVSSAYEHNDIQGEFIQQEGGIIQQSSDIMISN